METFKNTLGLQNFKNYREIFFVLILISTWYKNSNESKFKLIVLDEKLARNFLGQSRLSQVKKNIELNKNIKKHQHQQYMKQFIKIAVLKEFGGVFIDQHLILDFKLNEITQIWSQNYQSQIYNRWEEQPEVFMFHQDSQVQKKQNKNKNPFKPTYFKNFYNQQIQQAWYLNYDLSFIASVKNSSLLTEWLQKYEKFLTPQEEKQENQLFSKEQNFQGFCKDFSKSTQNESLRQYLSTEKIFDCLLKKRQKQLDEKAFYMDLQLDFVSSARFYKIWSMESQKIILSNDSLKQNSLNKIQQNNSGKQDNQKIMKSQETIKSFKIITVQNLIFQKQQNILKNINKQVDYFKNVNGSSQEITLSQIYKKTNQNMVELLTDHKKLKEEQNLENDDPVNKIRQFQIPKVIWYFIRWDLFSQRIFYQMNYWNMKSYAQSGGYQIKEVNQRNYIEHLSETSVNKIQSLFTHLESLFLNDSSRTKIKSIEKQNLQKMKNQEMENLLFQIKKRLIIYFLIHQNGGVFIDKSLTIVEDLDKWIRHFMFQKYDFLNCGDKQNVKSSVFGFYREEYSSLRTSQNILREYETEKEVSIFPTIDDSFIAAKKGSEFMQKLIETYMNILYNKNTSLYIKRIKNNKKIIGKTDINKIYEDGHLIAWQSVLQQKQQEFDSQRSTKEGDFRKLAIDHYGLVTIKSYLSIEKLSKYFQDQEQWDHPTFPRFTKLKIKLLQYQTGQLNYAIKFSQSVINETQMKLQIYTPTSTSFIFKQSFLSYFLINPSLQGIKKHFGERSILVNENNNRLNEILKNITVLDHDKIFTNPIINPSNQQWTKLQKNVWIIWDEGLQRNSNAIVELTSENLRRSSINSGFQFHVVTQKNVHQYIDQDILKQINKAVQNADYFLPQQAIPDLWRIAIILKYGGIYLDASTFTIHQNFDWIKYIQRLPSNLFWNRYGEQPEVLMFFNGHCAAPLDWQIDYRTQTRAQWHLAYQNNFFAAVKGSLYIKEWFNVFLRWVTLPYELIEKDLKQVNMNDKYLWTAPHDRYLSAMDALKYVSGRKQNELKIQKNKNYYNAADYYKIWSLSGHMVGQQKLRIQNNYYRLDYRQDMTLNDDNPFIYKYSLQYSEKIIGKIKYQGKLFNIGLILLNEILDKIYRQDQSKYIENMQKYIHPNSLIAKSLKLNQSSNLVQYYSKVSRMKLKFKGIDKMFY